MCCNAATSAVIRAHATGCHKKTGKGKSSTTPIEVQGLDDYEKYFLPERDREVVTSKGLKPPSVGSSKSSLKSLLLFRGVLLNSTPRPPHNGAGSRCNERSSVIETRAISRRAQVDRAPRGRPIDVMKAHPGAGLARTSYTHLPPYGSRRNEEKRSGTNAPITFVIKITQKAYAIQSDVSDTSLAKFRQLREGCPTGRRAEENILPRIVRRVAAQYVTGTPATQYLHGRESGSPRRLGSFRDKIVPKIATQTGDTIRREDDRVISKATVVRGGTERRYAEEIQIIYDNRNIETVGYELGGRQRATEKGGTTQHCLSLTERPKSELDSDAPSLRGREKRRMFINSSRRNAAGAHSSHTHRPGVGSYNPYVFQLPTSSANFALRAPVLSYIDVFIFTPSGRLM
ncbi:hypothetical protein EVAR_21580_1 [Eumeta japonica]|uniref:Uncharacterized protein n=1 Tax=Eumeta variegata TaxID=151549 RepID=A0A4C1UYV1_EUMVA|nr:hypothetical protein EVAR_21580_1 [Eumeta japonica]